MCICNHDNLIDSTKNNKLLFARSQGFWAGRRVLRPLGQVQSLKEQKAKWRKQSGLIIISFDYYQKGRWRLIYLKRKAILSFSVDTSGLGIKYVN